jgi:hypothetical protein
MFDWFSLVLRGVNARRTLAVEQQRWEVRCASGLQMKEALLVAKKFTR